MKGKEGDTCNGNGIFVFIRVIRAIRGSFSAVFQGRGGEYGEQFWPVNDE